MNGINSASSDKFCQFISIRGANNFFFLKRLSNLLLNISIDFKMIAIELQKKWNSNRSSRFHENHLYTVIYVILPWVL